MLMCLCRDIVPATSSSHTRSLQRHGVGGTRRIPLILLMFTDDERRILFGAVGNVSHA